MFGSLSFNEILFIMVLALLIFGPKRLPQMGRTIGRALGEFRRASSDLKRSMEIEMTAAEGKGGASETPIPAAPPVEAVPVAATPSTPAEASSGEAGPEETDPVDSDDDEVQPEPPTESRD